MPTVAITGTNGKTTTTRLVANLVMASGQRTAWNSTDGVYAANDDLTAGVLVEAGDWAGFGGAGKVLSTPRIQVAVIEVARGGILRRGMGVAAVDVGVVTNVSADHMGDLGVHTLADLAAVKSTVVRAVKPEGWAVLNADDSLVRGMASACRGGIIGFSADPDSAGLAELAADGGRQVTVRDGQITCIDQVPVPVVPVAEVPITIGGLSRVNLANALAATAAAWGLGIDPQHIAAGLRRFVADARRNPGRLNIYLREGLAVVVDVAHNPESVEALCRVGRGLLPPGGTLRMIAGTMGDRAEDLIIRIGALSAGLSDVAVIAQKDRFLRGRDAQRVNDLLNLGAVQAGRPEMPVHRDELVALDTILEQCDDGDVIAFAVHVHLTDIADELADRGFHAATADEIAERIAAGTGTPGD